MENVYLDATTGMTTTSANHLANIAKEEMAKDEMFLAGISFVGEDVTFPKSGDSMFTVKIPNGVFSNMDKSIERIAYLTSFIAWVREASKVKESLLEDLNDMPVTEYCKNIAHIEYPKYPERAISLQASDILFRDYNEDQIYRYLKLQSQVATIGKYIHPGGTVSKAYKQVIDSEINPIKMSNEGDDVKIITYRPSVSVEDFSKRFFTLQSNHRALQSEYNKIKSEIDAKIIVDITEKQKKYLVALDLYNITQDKLNTEKDLYISEELARISKLKIKIPKELKVIYDELNALGK